MEFLAQLTVLRLAYTLTQNMFALVGGNTADVLGFKRNFDDVAGHGARFVLLRLFRQQIAVGIGDLGHDVFAHIHLHFLLVGIDLAKNNVLVVVIALDCGHNRFLDTVAQRFELDMFFAGQHAQCNKEFLIHSHRSPFLVFSWFRYIEIV